MMEIINYIVNYILGVPSILIGIIACIGLIVQKKAFHEIMGGTFKTIIGFMLISAGTTVLANVLTPVTDMLQTAFGIQGVIGNDEGTVVVVLLQYGNEVILTMLSMFVFNLLIARFTRFKQVYLSGHVLLFAAGMSVVLLETNWSTLPDWAIILLGGFVSACCIVFGMSITQKYMDKITGNAGVALGHASCLSSFIAGWLGEKFGDPSHSAENIKFPKWISFFRDSTLSTAGTMVIFLLVISIVAGSSVVSTVAGEQGGIMWSITNGLQFGVGVTIVLSGVRMLISELVPAFKGFTEKIIPNAIPGLDCPIVMPYAPNSWLLGFVISFPIGLFFTFLMAGPLHMSTVVVACSVPYFFTGGPAGVFGNATGGIKGVVLGAIATAVLMSFGVALLIPLTGEAVINSGFIWPTPDFAVFGTLFGYIAKLLGSLFI